MIRRISIGELRSAEDYAKLPCGCEMGTVIANERRAFVFKPCSIDCKFYQYTIDESHRQKKPAELQWHPEVRS